jgi:hypothetical protein
VSIDSYAQAAEMCQKRGKPADSRKIGNNTYIERRGEDFAVRLHNTDILTIRPDDSFVVDTDGWLTVTTKDRLNTFAPRGVQFASDRGQWKVCFNGWSDIGSKPYADGMVIYPSSEGGWTTDPDTELEKALAEADVHNKATRKAIDKYVKDFRFPQTRQQMEDLGGIDVAGDCWYCGMTLENGQSMGDFSGSDHLESHMDEKYYVPSLVVNAVKETGRDPGYMGYMIERVDPDEHPGLGSLKRDVKSYMSKRLLVGVAPTHGGQMVHGDVIEWYRQRHAGDPEPVRDEADLKFDTRKAKMANGQEITVGRLYSR